MLQKLRFKFVLINMSIVTLMLGVILGLIFYFTESNLESESIHMMQAIAANPLQAAAPLPGEDPENAQEAVRLPFFALQVGPDGELLTAGGGYYDLSDDALLAVLVEEALTSPKSFGVIREYHLRYYRAETPLSCCIVFADISSELTTLEHLVQTCALIGILSFLAFSGISILLSRWAVRPVEWAFRQQRQFVADASHELKTPLTVILTSAELMQSPDYDEKDRAAFTGRILTMARQMRGLLEQMLELARSDQAQAEPLLETVDFSRLVSDALLPFEPVFFENGRTLTSEIAPDICVTGNAGQLRQVVEILLDNARKYSSEGGTTHVTLYVGSDSSGAVRSPRRTQGNGRFCLLRVADEGPEIPPEELTQIFRRFYRADSAHSRTGSFGLGLSIAESILIRHHGHIRAESRDGINTFHVELPCL